MSETEYHYGKITNTNLAPNEYVEKLPEEKRPTQEDMTWHDDISGWLREEFYDKIIVIDGEVWEIDDKESNPDSGIFEAKLEEDGSYSYVLQYYNGGCSFEEALLSALGKS